MQTQVAPNFSHNQPVAAKRWIGGREDWSETGVILTEGRPAQPEGWWVVFCPGDTTGRAIHHTNLRAV